tara:strand:- start:2365 stop:2577 length:213 start_codon:yes stop_codon:yes gene_type:complete
MGVYLSSIFTTIYPDIIDTASSGLVLCNKWFFIRDKPKFINNINIDDNINLEDDWGFFVEIDDGIDNRII